MDSYVLAETFKYLYLLFSEKEDLILNVDDYVFTTEAHLLPLFLSSSNSAQNFTEDSDNSSEDTRAEGDEEEYDFRNTCPSTSHLFKGKIDFAHHLRSPLKNMVENLCPKPKSSELPRLKASEFIAGNKDQVALLSRMGIRIITMTDGRVQLLHLANEAASPEDSSDGLLFMQEMVELSKAQAGDAPLEPRVVQLMSPPYFGSVILKAGPAQFGVNLKNHPGIEGPLVVASPLRCCQPLSNSGEVAGKFVMVERGDCMFVDKARHLQNAGAIGAIIFDNNSQSSADSSQLFSMSGDGKADVIIPLVFLFRAEAKAIQEALTDHPDLIVYVSERHKRPEDVLLQYLSYQTRSLTLESQRSRESVEGSSSLDAELESVSGSRIEKAESDLETSIRGLIVLLLRRINLERLEPFIRRRSREKLDSRIGGSFPVRLIRMPDSPDHGVRVESEDTQRVVRVVFTEFLMLVLECTNLKQLSSLNQVVDTLARLTESVFTGGRMGFGVHTETTLDEIKNRLVVKASCSSPAMHPAVPVAAAEREGGMAESSPRDDSSSMSQDDVNAKADLDFAGGDLDVEYERRKQLVRRFLEDQFGIVPGGMTSDSTTQESDTLSQDPSLESSKKLVFIDGPLPDGVPLDGPRLQEEDPSGKIRPNFALEEKSETVAQVSSDAIGGVDEVTICDPNTVVDDVSKVKISDITGEPIWQDSHGVTWKHRDSCWSTERKSGNGKIENVAPDESGVNKLPSAQSDTPKRISGDGVMDENYPARWDSTEEGESYTISESDEEVIIEYNAQMSALEQRLRSSDIETNQEFNHFTNQEYDHETSEMTRRRAAAEEEENEGENFQFWEMGLGKDFKEDAQAHVLEKQTHEKIPIPVPNAVTGEELFVLKEDANSPDSMPVRTAHEPARMPNSEQSASSLHGRARPKTDGDTSENFTPSDSEATNSPRTRN